MKRTWAMAAVAVLAVGIAVQWARRSVPVEPQVRMEEVSPRAQGDHFPPAVSGAEQTLRARPRAEQRGFDDEQTASARRGAFHERARAFFAEAPALDPAERQRRAREIESEIDEHETSRALSAGEAFVLRSALIRETIADPDLRQRQQQALADRYRQDAERRIASATRSDPEFELYKAREAEIVAQVMAMDEIPGGLSRDEYLRRRLQSEREALLGDR
jgi:hypothetical protein